MLSLVVVAAMAACFLPSQSITGQESGGCQKCPAGDNRPCPGGTVESKGIKVSFATKDDAEGQEGCNSTGNGKKKITIRLSCAGTMPLLANLPLFGSCDSDDEAANSSIVTEACVSGQAETTDSCHAGCCASGSGACCGHSGDNQATCDESCCGTCSSGNCDKVEVATTCEGGCDCDSPCFASLSDVAPVCQSADAGCAGQSCDGHASCGSCDGPCPECPGGQTSCSTADETIVRMTGHVQEATHTGPTRTELMHQLMEMRISNERLKMQLQAMERQMQVMHEMSQLRAENAILKARLEWSGKPPVHASVPGPLPPRGFGQAGPELHAAHPPVASSGQLRLPVAPHAAVVVHSEAHVAEIQKLQEQIRELHRKLKQQAASTARRKATSETNR
jgi:hypothetical protein